MDKKQIIETYLLNEPHVIAEMLYDTITRYEQQLSNLKHNYEMQEIMIADYKKRVEELENATIPFLTMTENRALRKRIEELETPKSCEGCKHLFGYFQCNEADCSRYHNLIGYPDYYEPKDKNV